MSRSWPLRRFSHQRQRRQRPRPSVGKRLLLLPRPSCRTPSSRLRSPFLETTPTTAVAVAAARGAQQQQASDGFRSDPLTLTPRPGLAVAIVAAAIRRAMRRARLPCKCASPIALLPRPRRHPRPAAASVIAWRCSQTRSSRGTESSLSRTTTPSSTVTVLPRQHHWKGRGQSPRSVSRRWRAYRRDNLRKRRSARALPNRKALVARAWQSGGTLRLRLKVLAGWPCVLHVFCHLWLAIDPPRARARALSLSLSSRSLSLSPSFLFYCLCPPRKARAFYCH